MARIPSSLARSRRCCSARKASHCSTLTASTPNSPRSPSASRFRKVWIIGVSRARPPHPRGRGGQFSGRRRAHEPSPLSRPLLRARGGHQPCHRRRRVPHREPAARHARADVRGALRPHRPALAAARPGVDPRGRAGVLPARGAGGMPVASALLLDLAPPERRQAVLAVNYTGMSVAYTLGVMPAGYVAEQGYVLLGAISSIGYLLVAALYAVALRGALPLERARTEARLLTDMLSVTRDRLFLGFAALTFIFPLAMGQVVTVSPLFAADEGLGEGYIGLVLGGNSIIVALLAVPVATRMEASGPFRLLGLAACLVSAAFCCYAMLPDAAAALLLGTVIFSFGELVFSSAAPAAVARLAPPGRRAAYQGGWTLIASLSMGSALFLSGLLRDAIGWRGAWLSYAVPALALAAMLFVTRDRFLKAQNEWAAKAPAPQLGLPSATPFRRKTCVFQTRSSLRDQKATSSRCGGVKGDRRSRAS